MAPLKVKTKLHSSRTYPLQEAWANLTFFFKSGIQETCGCCPFYFRPIPSVLSRLEISTLIPTTLCSTICHLSSFPTPALEVKNQPFPLPPFPPLLLLPLLLFVFLFLLIFFFSFSLLCCLSSQDFFSVTLY